MILVATRPCTNGIWGIPESQVTLYTPHILRNWRINSTPYSGEQVAVGPGLLKHHVLFILCIG